MQGTDRDARVDNRLAGGGEERRGWGTLPSPPPCVKHTASGKLLYGKGRLEPVATSFCSDD